MTASPAAAAAPKGAEPPARRRTVSVAGLCLAVYEWGALSDPPIVLAHGGGDFARSFDVFAPLLARSGRRVVSWDQRGHGDSDAAAFYGWDADAFDGAAVIEELGAGAVPVIGHSKGGMVLSMIADARPDLVSHLVSIDGFPTHYPDAGTRGAFDQRLAERRTSLDHRRLGRRERRPAELDELAARRGRASSRLRPEWLQHMVRVGADPSPEGWRWKGDPALRQLLSNPVDLADPIRSMAGLQLPVLAILGLHLEVTAMGSTAEFAEQYLPAHGELLAYEDSGHFVHVEHPARVVAAIEDFLERHPGPPRVPPCR